MHHRCRQSELYSPENILLFQDSCQRRVKSDPLTSPPTV
ncbi:exopolygalacturonate lyase [Salmonella enterica]|nr:exopolygalacturonate lyase [Salmonella enterica]